MDSSARSGTTVWEEWVRLNMPFPAVVNHFVGPSQFILANVDCLFPFGEILPNKKKSPPQPVFLGYKSRNSMSREMNNILGQLAPVCLRGSVGAIKAILRKRLQQSCQ